MVIICNVLYAQFEEKKNKVNFLQLYSDMMIARDLCQYDSLDNFCLRNIVKCRNDVEKGLGASYLTLILILLIGILNLMV